jgi:hypothetical protein
MGIDNDDNVIVYKELYQTQLLYGTLSEMVKSMMGPEEIYLAMDPAALNKKSEST